MFEIIKNTPIYAWILLGLIVWKGVRARRLHQIPWKDLIIFPIVMVGWSFYATYNRYEPAAFIYWTSSFILGVVLGPLFVRSLKMRIDKSARHVELSGSWIPLGLMLLIFSVRYFLGVMYGMHSSLKGTPELLSVECFAATLSGILAGRILALYRKSKRLPHTELTKS
ncbi:MAG: hypothetical protein KDK64_03985 [Chlamydiia bacterium]|nr:hypothetical protein [Chlamydiia bacterium]